MFLLTNINILIIHNITGQQVNIKLGVNYMIAVNRILILILIFATLIFSGCEGEDQATTNPTLPSNQQSIPEIKLVSFTSVYSLNNYNQNPSPVFMWDNVPGNESDKLIEHLKSLEYDWVENAQITKTNEYLFCWDEVLVEISKSYFDFFYFSDFLQKYGSDELRGAIIKKSDDNRTINVFDENQSLSLKLNYDKTRMILTRADGENEEFLVKMEDGKLNVYGDENKTIRVYDDENSLMIILRSNTGAFLETLDSKGYFPVKEEDGKIILYDLRSTLSYNSTEKYYAVYNILITNNGSKTFNFTIYDMHLLMGDQMFNSTPVELREINPPFNLIAESASLSPGQNLTGCIIFQVNSSYDKSFQLMYNSTPVISESFESTVEALTISEHFNYSTVFDTPQFVEGYSINERNVDKDNLEPDDLYPAAGYYPLVWPNWVDRNTVEFYKELDHQNLLKNSVSFGISGLPRTIIEYELSVTPNRNITITRIETPSPRPEDHLRLIIVDDGKEEIMNNSMDYAAIIGSQTYELNSENIPQMNISNATIVRTEFFNVYGWGMASRITHNRQIVVLDENQNMVMAAYNPGHCIS
ncbi:MAG: DUF4352 domain-containing protein [ANME-2 cluster archaeon]|nr:MAG: DUF4352 domain-containing protein [ANME-2 cluster archaeon]